MTFISGLIKLVRRIQQGAILSLTAQTNHEIHNFGILFALGSNGKLVRSSNLMDNV